jgi:hypothetical protein
VWSADGRSLGQQPGRLPLPPRLHQRSTSGSERAKNLYVREDHILASLPAHLAILALDDELGPEERGVATAGDAETMLN